MPKEKNLFRHSWSELLDSNQRPLEPHSSAIPNFATPGYLLASLNCLSILAHLSKKSKHYFLFFQNFLRPAASPRQSKTCGMTAGLRVKANVPAYKNRLRFQTGKASADLLPGPLPSGSSSDFLWWKPPTL